MSKQDDIVEIDTIGLKCPLPVLKARKRLKSMAAGEHLRILADDPAGMIDIPHFCTEQGHDLVHQSVDGATLTFVICKGN